MMNMPQNPLPGSGRSWFALGAWLAAMGVMAGAFGAHALKDKISPEMIAVYDTGARYHLMHAIGLLAVGLAADRFPSRRIDMAGWLLTIGIFLFSGSLYALAVTGNKALGMVTPLGGLAWIVGWIMLAFAVQAPGTEARG